MKIAAGQPYSSPFRGHDSSHDPGQYGFLGGHRACKAPVYYQGWAG
jgi:hypothetical protein